MATQTTTFGPYSPIRQTGNLYFISGQIGVDAATGSASHDIASQTRQALRNLQRVLADAGLQMDHVVKTTIFLTNMDDFAAVNKVYQTFFEPPRPARSTVGVAQLPKVGGDTPMQIEIEAIAAVPSSEQS